MQQRTLCLKISPELRAEFKRACQLLNRTQSQVLQKAIISAIRQARETYGDRFECSSLAEEAVLEAVESGRHELQEIVAYTHLPAAEVIAALKRLVARRVVERRLTGKATVSNYAGARPAELFFLPMG